MNNNIEKRGSLAIGPNGNVLTVADLPNSAKIRWVPRRKAEVVSAVASGLLTMSEACARYAVSLEEFSQWQKDWANGGLKHLRVSRPRMSAEIVAHTDVAADSQNSFPRLVSSQP